MEQNDKTIDQFSTDKQAPVLNDVSVFGLMPMYRQIYQANYIVNWKLIIPNQLSVTASANPLAIIRLSPWMIFSQSLAEGETAEDAPGEIALSPIQFPYKTYNSKSNFKILSFNNPVLPQNLFMSHQYIKGSLNVSVRVNSNVGVSGNLVYTVVNNVPRNWNNTFIRSKSPKYLGFDTDLSLKMQAHACKSFTMNDLSLVRHNITTVPTQELNKFIDSSNLMSEVNRLNRFDTNLDKLTNFYTEDIMLVYALSDITSSSAGPITLDVIYDFSNVAYETPIIPAWFQNDADYYNEQDYNRFYYDNGSSKSKKVIQELSTSLDSIHI